MVSGGSDPKWNGQKNGFPENVILKMVSEMVSADRASKQMVQTMVPQDTSPKRMVHKVVYRALPPCPPPQGNGHDHARHHQVPYASVAAPWAKSLARAPGECQFSAKGGSDQSYDSIFRRGITNFTMIVNIPTNNSPSLYIYYL